MIIEQGEKVITSEGDVAGEISRVVLDPKTKEVTDIVVKEGFLFKEERVVPIDLVQYSDEEELQLRDTPVDFNKLPVFEETHHILLDEEELNRMEGGSASAYYRFPPLYSGGWMAESEVARPYLEKRVENIPEGTVALKEGATVLDLDGEPVGDVEQILTETQQDQATHLVVLEGLIFKEKKLIPIEWVSTIMEGEVHLAVGPQILESAPSFD